MTGKIFPKSKKLNLKNNMRMIKFCLKLKEMIAKELINICKKLKLFMKSYKKKSKK